MNKITGVILVLIAASVFGGCDSIQDFGMEFFQHLDYDIHSLLSQLFTIMDMGPMSGQIDRFQLLWNMHNKFNTIAENLFKTNIDVINSIKVKSDNRTVKFVSTIYKAIDELAHNVNTPAPFIDPGNNLTGIPAVSQEESLAFISDFTNKFENFTIIDIISKALDVRGFKQQIDKAQVKKRRRRVRERELKVWQPSNPEASDNKTRRMGKDRYPQYPFVVSIHEMNEFVCAGAVLGNLYVLTAASCLHLCYQNKDILKNNTTVQVRAGSDHSKSGGQLISAARVIFHPEYNPMTLTNNLAFIQLKWGLNMKGKSANIMKILFKKRDEFEDVKHVVMIGWGDKELAPAKDVLTGTKMDVVPFLPCANIYTEKYVTSSNFCGAILKGTLQDICLRDIGSPAVVGNTLVGLVSYGPSVCGPPSAPTVYSDLGEYADWMTSVLRQKRTLRVAAKTHPPKTKLITPSLHKLMPTKYTMMQEIKSTTKRKQTKPTTKRQQTIPTTKRQQTKTSTKRQEIKQNTKHQEQKTSNDTAKRAIDLSPLVSVYPDAVQLLSLLLKKIVSGNVRAATVADVFPGFNVNITVAEEGDQDITLNLSANQAKLEVHDVNPATPKTTTDKNVEGSSESEYSDTESYLSIVDATNVSEEVRNNSRQKNTSKTNITPTKENKHHKSSKHETPHPTTSRKPKKSTINVLKLVSNENKDDESYFQEFERSQDEDKVEKDEIEQIIKEVKTRMKLQSAGGTAKKDNLQKIVEEVIINHEQRENPTLKESQKENEVSEIENTNHEMTNFANQYFADVPEETETDSKALSINSSHKSKKKATKNDVKLHLKHMLSAHGAHGAHKKEPVGNKALQNVKSNRELMMSKNFKIDTRFAQVGTEKQTTNNYFYLVMKKPEDILKSFALVSNESQEKVKPPKMDSNFASSEVIRVLRQENIMRTSADQKLPPITLDLSDMPEEIEERRVAVDLESDDISMYEKLLKTATATTADYVNIHLGVAEPWAYRRANQPRRRKKILKDPASMNKTTGQVMVPQRRNNALPPRRFAIAKSLNFDIGNDFKYDIYGRPLPTPPTPRTTRKIQLNFNLDFPMSNLFASKTITTKPAPNQFYNFDILKSGTQITQLITGSDFSAAPYQNNYVNDFAASPSTTKEPEGALFNSARYQQIYQEMLNAGLRQPLSQSENLNDALQGYNQNVNAVSNTPPSYPQYATQPSTFNSAGNTQSFALPGANNPIDYEKMMEQAFGNMALQQSQINENKHEPIIEREPNIDALVENMPNADLMGPNMQLQINNAGPMNSMDQNMQLMMNNAGPISENIQRMGVEPNIERPEFDADLDYALQKRRVPDGEEKSRHSHGHSHGGGGIDDYMNDFKQATLGRKLAMATRTDRHTQEVQMIVGDDYNYDARSNKKAWTNEPVQTVDDLNIAGHLD